MKTTILTATLLFGLFSCKAQTKHLGVGDHIPMFSLKATDGKMFNIADYVGKKILVIYFYPKDESGGCTKEACTFRDSYTDFTNEGAMVIGINYASPETHKAFLENHQLPFTLLSDPGNAVLKQFGVKDKLVFTGRETFVVDLSGKIIYTFDSFTKGGEHSEKALAAIKQLTKK